MLFWVDYEEHLFDVIENNIQGTCTYSVSCPFFFPTQPFIVNKDGNSLSLDFLDIFIYRYYYKFASSGTWMLARLASIQEVVGRNPW